MFFGGFHSFINHPNIILGISITLAPQVFVLFDEEGMVFRYLALDDHNSKTKRDIQI